jgi:hypothetical protein
MSSIDKTKDSAPAGVPALGTAMRPRLLRLRWTATGFLDAEKSFTDGTSPISPDRSPQGVIQVVNGLLVDA